MIPTDVSGTIGAIPFTGAVIVPDCWRSLAAGPHTTATLVAFVDLVGAVVITVRHGAVPQR